MRTARAAARAAPAGGRASLPAPQPGPVLGGGPDSPQGAGDGPTREELQERLDAANTRLDAAKTRLDAAFEFIKHLTGEVGHWEKWQIDVKNKENRARAAITQQAGPPPCFFKLVLCVIIFLVVSFGIEG
eukprot:gene37320-34899_t